MREDKELIQVEICKPHEGPKETLNKAQIELYKYLKRKHDMGEQFIKSELLEIYAKWVKPQKRKDPRDYDENMLYNCASGWLDRSISAMVRRGYLGLIFKVSNDVIGDYEGSLMGNRRKVVMSKGD